MTSALPIMAPSGRPAAMAFAVATSAETASHLPDLPNSVYCRQDAGFLLTFFNTV